MSYDKSLRILLIEDEPEHAELLQRGLKRLGYAKFDITWLQSLSEGLKAVKSISPDVILLDLSLPDSELKDTLNRTLDVVGDAYPIVVMSSLEDQEWALQEIKKGAQDFLFKTKVDADQLYKAILFSIERKEIEKNLKRVNIQLESLNEELNNYTHFVSHDLKEPLRGIQFICSTISDHKEKFDPSDQEGIDKIERLAISMRELIDGLLSLSLINYEAFDLQKISINNIIAQRALLLDQNLKEVGADLRIEESLPNVYCEPIHMGEVFHNLITNAYKYNEKTEKKIEIGVVEENNGYVTLFVKDNGIGIKEPYRKKIFEGFKRLHGKDKFGGGNGIGLTIVKKIVQKHGGDIWCESVYGEGTTFYVTLRTEPVDARLNKDGPNEKNIAS